MHWIDVTQERDQLRAPVNTVMLESCPVAAQGAASQCFSSIEAVIDTGLEIRFVILL
jgi:hypothetical protein